MRRYQSVSRATREDSTKLTGRSPLIGFLLRSCSTVDPNRASPPGTLLQHSSDQVAGNHTSTDCVTGTVLGSTLCELKGLVERGASVTMENAISS
mmetsp:Transcript_41974/g.110571  ORF Transcript_41974/g.110571 Transcript_41974/m.110571 type:complete len:95 (+) Transcript_41974:137-421(+)